MPTPDEPSERELRRQQREEIAELKREFREDALRMREEMAAQWQAAMAAQMEELGRVTGADAGRGAGRGPGFGRGPGGPRGGGFGGGPGSGGPRSRRPGRAPLSREAIAEEAARIVDKDGLNKLTMRRVAHNLDTGPASLYAYVHSMNEILGMLLDRAIGALDLDRGDDDWRARTARLLDDYVDLLMAQPDLARSALVAPPSGENQIALIECLLALMDEGGIPADRRAWGVDILVLWATAAAVEHASLDGDGGPMDSRDWEGLRTATSQPERFPQITALGLDLFSGTGEQRARWGIEVLLSGIAATPRG